LWQEKIFRSQKRKTRSKKSVCLTKNRPIRKKGHRKGRRAPLAGGSRSRRKEGRSTSKTRKNSKNTTVMREEGGSVRFTSNGV